MSKKNDKKSVKKIRNNYRIESLEPRMLMDASASQWMYEVVDVALTTQSQSILDSSNFYDQKNWVNAGDVDGLCVVDNTNDEIQSVSKADFMDTVENNTSGTFDSQQRLQLAKYVLFRSIVYANGGMPSTDADGNIVNDNLLSAEDIFNAFNALYGGNSVVSASDTISINLNDTRDQILMFSSHFGFDIGQVGSYDADAGASLGIEGGFSYEGINQHLEFVVNLDGNKLTDNGLVAARYASAMFNQIKNMPAKYGVVDLVADQDDGIDFCAGTMVQITNATSAVEYKDGLIAQFEFGLNDPNGYLGSILPSKLAYGKMGMYPGSWLEEVGGTWQPSSMDSFRKITMGKILGKLQELSSELTAVQQGQRGANVNFGGILASDTQSLMSLSIMIDSVLKQNPNSLQELVDCFKASHFSSNNSVAYSWVNGNLEIHFDFKIDETNAKFINPDWSSTNVFDVSISRETLKQEMNLDVQRNDGVKVKSDVTLGFDLVIPLVESPKADASTQLVQILGSEVDYTTAMAGKIVVGNGIYHEPWSFAVPAGCYAAGETAIEADGVSTYCNRLVLWKSVSAALTDSEVEAFLNMSHLNVDAPMYGYLVDISGITELNYESVKYDINDPDTKAPSLYQIIIRLKEIFAKTSTKVHVEGFNGNHVIIGSNQFDGLVNIDAVLNKITELASVSAAKQVIWLSNKARPNITVASDVAFEVSIGGASKGQVVLDKNDINTVSNMSELSVLFQKALDDLLKNTSDKILVETDQDRLVFKSSSDFNFNFYGNAWIFGLTEVAPGGVSANDGTCIEISILE